MLGWLSSWLQQIIAVVLLAGLIDLLLPNKAMQRYVRLVAGLIILLTILTPIIRLLHGDFSAKLDQDVAGWFQGEKTRDVRMPTLDDIKKDASDLKKKQQGAALSLTQRKLTEEMRSQIERRTNRKVEGVALELEAVTTGITAGALIKSVTVTFSTKPPESAGDSRTDKSETGRSDSVAVIAEPIEEVPTVSVNVQVENRGTSPEESQNRGSDYIPVNRSLADTVKQVLQDQWSVEPGIVSVVERKGDGLAEQ
ncbi:hypothetical protein Back11_24610 [Paenibacillus baekrokdamisoli]|uniref:Uncharacterized protein n=1 Tax=Paenibacillus baekrokdamisoli TaxID=1712516 RepID=A0A3G9IRT3_9BACL|nr:stage III sporulation protein AF [Paenibacillus baekrokdamisoli]MBB3070104.1 stage III sporulation protein AF [Paenibacillus baekrokdamisoli]BBH21116.1 hypothetical protein Back11_24610 [Paenibacillus baekrokdamisoli]